MVQSSPLPREEEAVHSLPLLFVVNEGVCFHLQLLCRGQTGGYVEHCTLDIIWCNLLLAVAINADHVTKHT